MPQGKTMVESEYLLLPCLSDSEWNCDKYETTLTPPLSPSCVKVQIISESDSSSEHFGLRNEVRHDCMWSGTCSLDCVRKNMYRPRTKSISEDCFQANPLDVCGRPTTPAFLASSRAAATTGVASDSSNNTTCEDTFNVVNTTLNDHCYSQATQQSQKDSQATQQSQKCANSSQTYTKKIVNVTLSDTPSDSDSEIDVVSCSWQKKRRRESATKSAVKVQCRKRQFEHQLMSSGSSSSSRSSSDSEDTEKRSQHNTMERQRRDHLRFGFEILRDNVPALKDVQRAPKVLILNQTEQYVRQLYNTNKELEGIKKAENKRNIELTKRVRQLKQTMQ